MITPTFGFIAMGERVRVDGVNEYILEREKDLDDTGLGSDTESPDEDD